MHQEPHGEERDDLRMGALASVIWNCNIDTKDGMITPHSYIAGFNSERDSIFAFYPKREDEYQEKKSAGRLDLNDPIGWENFTTGLIKAVGGRARRKE